MAATAFPWRNHVASVQWYVGVGSSSGYSPALDWVGHAHELLGDRSRGGYLGYVESGRSLREYFAGNYDRVAATRRRYDPDSIIR